MQELTVNEVESVSGGDAIIVDNGTQCVAISNPMDKLLYYISRGMTGI